MELNNLKKQLIEKITSANSEAEILEISKYIEDKLSSKQSFDGSYHIKGVNQNALKSSYKGKLLINQLSENRITAVWTIGENQHQYGFGFFHKNTLIINFYYLVDDSNEKLKGVAVYKMDNKGNLKGFWSEKHGDDNYLGFETGIKYL